MKGAKRKPPPTDLEVAVAVCLVHAARLPATTRAEIEQSLTLLLELVEEAG